MSGPKPVFVSASFPDKKRNSEYWNARKLMNLREAVRALTAKAVADRPLVFGGHPSITPLVHGVVERMAHRAKQEGREGFDPNRRILVYQSDYFADKLPKEVRHFPYVVMTPAVNDDGRITGVPGEAGNNREMSLLYMRYQMIVGGGGRRSVPAPFAMDGFGSERIERFGTDEFDAAFFLGGMEGVVHEYNIFRTFHPRTPVFPIATTGSSAVQLFERASRQRLFDRVDSPLMDSEKLEDLLASSDLYTYLFDRLLDPDLRWALPEPSVEEIRSHLEQPRHEG